MQNIEEKKSMTTQWFVELRDKICSEFESIEADINGVEQKIPGVFERKIWEREGGGGGQMSVMRGRVFEKVGVNISTVYGEFSEQFAKEIPGAQEDRSFFATGISLVAHMHSPFVPAVHMNTRFIVTSKNWFGGGADLTPTFPEEQESQEFHKALEAACSKYNEEYYPQFKKNCDDYFYLKHRNEPRGIGGIFYDYLDGGNWPQEFAFTQDVGKAFLDVYSKIVRRKMHHKWSLEDRDELLRKRGRYVEFNLLQDRGTKFGLMTNGNVEAILMSLPPEVKW